MAKPDKAPGWSNEVPKPDLIDQEMQTPTPREKGLAEAAERNKKIDPRLYDITSKNLSAPRVVHDSRGETVMIAPGETVRRVSLHPTLATYLTGERSDLVVVLSE